MFLSHRILNKFSSKITSYNAVICQLPGKMYLFGISLLDKKSQHRHSYTADRLSLTHQTGDTELTLYLTSPSPRESPLDMPLLPSPWCRLTSPPVRITELACATGRLGKSKRSLRKLMSLLHLFSSEVPSSHAIPLAGDPSLTLALYSSLATKDKHSKETR